MIVSDRYRIVIAFCPTHHGSYCVVAYRKLTHKSIVLTLSIWEAFQWIVAMITDKFTDNGYLGRESVNDLGGQAVLRLCARLCHSGCGAGFGHF